MSNPKPGWKLADAVDLVRKEGGGHETKCNQKLHGSPLFNPWFTSAGTEVERLGSVSDRPRVTRLPLVRCGWGIYAGGMRYPDGGGLSPAARGRRETVAVQAAQMFAADVPPVQVATRLRVSTKSAYQWRRRWRAGGEQALASSGPGGARCRLSDAQLHRLRIELERGPAEHGWADQRWTLARIATLIARLFHLRYTPRGTAYLLPPHGLVGAGAAAPRGASATRTRSPRGAP